MIIFVVAIFSLCADKLCPVLSIINSLRSVCDKFELCELFLLVKSIMVKVSTEEKTTMKQSSNKEHKIQPRRKMRVGDKPESGKTRVYRNYDRSDLVLAAKKVREENMTIYKVTKLTNVPYNTIKSFLNGK